MNQKSTIQRSYQGGLGFGFIKSGFESVQTDLESDFRRHGLEVVRAASVVLKPVVVDYIYRDSRTENFYPSMYRHLTANAVIAMALAGEDDNAQDILNDLKFGLNGRPNLRDKYAVQREWVPEDEVRLWLAGNHPDQDQITVRMTQFNVFHAADSTDEAAESLRLIAEHNPEFWS